ncbi:MAG: hypothetical protein ABI687_05460 [Flavitalea sp.]
MAVFYLETALSFSVLSFDFFTEIPNVELVNDAEPGNTGKEAEETIPEKSFLQPADTGLGCLTTTINEAPKRYAHFHAGLYSSFIPVFTPPPEICSLF